MNRPFIAFTGLSLLLLSGCMVGPKYTKPSVPMAPSFKEAPADSAQQTDGWKKAHPGDQLGRGNWWKIYADQQLNALEDQVDSSNQTLKIAEANFRQARTAIRFNKAAEAPTVSAGANISSVRDSANQPYFSAAQANNGEGNFTLAVDSSWEIDLWGRIRGGVTAAKEQTQASAADMAAVQVESAF